MSASQLRPSPEPPAFLLDLKIKDLLLFLRIYELRKLSEAAKVLGMSLPTAERKLNAIRKALGDRLFTRSGTAGAFMIPTERSNEIHPQIERLVSGCLRLHDAPPFIPSEIRKTFRLGANSHGLFFLPKDFFRSFARKCPRARLRIVRPTEDILEMLKAGEIDFGILNHELADDFPSLRSLPLYEGESRIVVRKGHPLAELRSGGCVSTDDLRRWPMVRLYSKPRRYHPAHYVDEALSDIPIDVAPTVEVPFLASAPYVVCHTDCTCICPEVIARQWVRTGEIVSLQADFLKRRFRLHLIWHERTHLRPEFQFVRSLILSDAPTAADSPTTTNLP